MCIDARVSHFQSFAGRLKTFSNWPRVQTPESLASVGFYRPSKSRGVDDVQCFHCGIRLADWDPRDQPLSEHLRWSKNCKFANLVKSLQLTKDLIKGSIKLLEILGKTITNFNNAHPYINYRPEITSRLNNIRNLDVLHIFDNKLIDAGWCINLLHSI